MRPVGAGVARPSGESGVSELRPPTAAVRTIAASSGKDRRGRHSSKPSCHTSESSVTAPSAALRRTSATRTGPTGTPLMATYQSSLAESSDISNGAEDSSSCWTVVLNAPASAPGFGAAGRAEVRLAANAVALGGAGLPAGRGGPAAWPGVGAAGRSVATLVSVTSARTSMRWPHLRHFIRTVLPTILSSAIWYLALHCSQRNFTPETRPRER